jgi:hypothetical protein
LNYPFIALYNFIFVTIFNENFDLGACAECNSERSLPDIRCSLQEKVNQLRAEKIIVEEKIREAQEDDKIRLKVFPSSSESLSECPALSESDVEGNLESRLKLEYPASIDSSILFL